MMQSDNHAPPLRKIVSIQPGFFLDEFLSPYKLYYDRWNMVIVHSLQYVITLQIIRPSATIHSALFMRAEN